MISKCSISEYAFFSHTNGISIKGDRNILRDNTLIQTNTGFQTYYLDNNGLETETIKVFGLDVVVTNTDTWIDYAGITVFGIGTQIIDNDILSKVSLSTISPPPFPNPLFPVSSI